MSSRPPAIFSFSSRGLLPRTDSEKEKRDGAWKGPRGVLAVFVCLIFLVIVVLLLLLLPLLLLHHPHHHLPLFRLLK